MEKRKKTSAVIRLLILAFIIIGVPALLYVNFRDTLFNTEWLRHLPQLLSRYRGHASAILIALQILQVFVCIIPGQPIQFAASYMFGIVGGYLISVTGAAIGATITFYVSRLLGKDAVCTLFDEEKIENYRRKLNSGKGLMAVFLIYLIPGIPKDLTAYAAGISDIRFMPFLVLSTIGRTPGMLGSILIGYFFNRGNYYAIAVLAVITAAMLIVFYIKRKDMIALLDNLENAENKADIEQLS
ncbi:MAG: TVP38/TMEM64 family protein [Mogibacterium sp.]|nr:TVP38/TMEM64 family protein [Mogibacterium sp.]